MLAKTTASGMTRTPHSPWPGIGIAPQAFRLRDEPVPRGSEVRLHLRGKRVPVDLSGGRRWQRRQAAEQAIRLAVEPGGEIHLVRIASIAAIAVDERPEPVILDRLAVRALQLAEEGVGVGV